MSSERTAPSIWWWAFGYFAAYVPYAALTKVVTSGLVDVGESQVTGVELLPSSVMATVVTAFVFLAATGWWRAALKDVGGRRLPWPSTPTVMSGVCSGGIIATTTLAYTFEGVSIVFVMLLMRGGLLVIAPIVDVIGGRTIRWFSLAALLLSLAALSLSMLGGGGTAITWVCAVDVALYLACYFARLRIMTSKAKSKDPQTNLRYFVEEQLVSSPSLLLALVVVAAIGQGAIADELRAGFTTFFDRPMWLYGILIGVLSQGTGIFGGLILLDQRENTFSVPVNRASSVLAGIVATTSIWLIAEADAPDVIELAGAGIMIVAILVLSLGGIADRRRAAIK